MKRWTPDLHSLSVQMILSFVALVLLTAAAAGLPAIWLIRDQLGRQAWAQVEQGRLAAQALYDAKQNELQSLATLTAQRPTLRGLLAEGAIEPPAEVPAVSGGGADFPAELLAQTVVIKLNGGEPANFLDVGGGANTANGVVNDHFGWDRGNFTTVSLGYLPNALTSQSRSNAYDVSADRGFLCKYDAARVALPDSLDTVRHFAMSLPDRIVTGRARRDIERLEEVPAATLEAPPAASASRHSRVSTPMAWRTWNIKPGPLSPPDSCRAKLEGSGG